MARRFEPYWVRPTNGDPIPTIGSGLRRVLASVGHKWVRIKPAHGEGNAVRIHYRAWRDSIPHLLDTGQDMCTVLDGLRLSPAKRASPVCQVSTK